MILFILINNFIVIVTGAVISFHINTDSIIGETVVLPCENKQGNELVQWTRRDKNTEKSFTTVYTDGWRVNPGLRLHERLMIIGSRGGQDYGLQISNVTMLDSGLYRCAVDTITNLTYYFVTLEVKDKYKNLRTHSAYTVINTTFPFMKNTEVTRFFSSIPIVSILSIPPIIIVVVLALIAAIILFQTRRKNKVSSSPVNNQPDDIEEVQQNDHYYDKVDYEEISCEVQNNSLNNEPSYHYPDSKNVETILVNQENPLTGPSQEIYSKNQASVSEQTEDYSYVSNLYQPLTEHWGLYSRTYAQCPPFQTGNDYHNIADPSQMGNMYQHLLAKREDVKHIYC
ncbi:uncharacterized protein LOC127722002 [Mytilus californianus]|uniref:uncharacterized protein LOC127722002 n=1 Tax=Mytilus californianus TaxID=6549 RepID=UPI002245B95D|nr:uncharacterized protein LOC127722002 [Mytilus californianus]